MRTSDLTASEAFVGSIVKEITVAPRVPAIRSTTPTPLDSSVHEGDAAEVGVARGSPQYSPEWLPGEESNLHQGIQSPLCYRYTTRHPVRIQSRQTALPGDSLIGEDGTLELPSHCALEASP